MQKHYYENHQHVAVVLTTKYGFKYTGIGDNAEECFLKETNFPERVFIHPMYCSYSMDSCKGIGGWINRPHDISFRSNYKDLKEQENAFAKLCCYLDEHSKKVDVVLTIENLILTLESLEEKRLTLIAMALDKNVSIESKKSIPLIYRNLIEYQSTLTYLIPLIK